MNGLPQGGLFYSPYFERSHSSRGGYDYEKISQKIDVNWLIFYSLIIRVASLLVKKLSKHWIDIVLVADMLHRKIIKR